MLFGLKDLGSHARIFFFMDKVEEEAPKLCSILGDIVGTIGAANRPLQ